MTGTMPDGAGQFNRLGGSLPGQETAAMMPSQLVAYAFAVNLNAAGDTVMALSAAVAGQSFFVDYCMLTNASTNLTTVELGVFGSAGGTGNEYMASGPVTDAVDGTVIVIGYSGGTTQGNAHGGFTGSIYRGAAAPIVNVSVPQGSDATADLYVFGRVLA